MTLTRFLLHSPLLATTLVLAVPVLAVPVAASLAAPAAAEEPYGKQKVVYHNNGAQPGDDHYFKGLLANVANHIRALGEENAEIVVVSHGGGVDMLQQAVTDPGLAKRIDALRGEGVRFLVCANTLNARKLTAADLYGAKEEDVVPSGVAEIAHLEQQGFVYMHP